jgi:acetolactate synthase-1/2/3 large subunit
VYKACHTHAELNAVLAEVLAGNEPVVCEVFLDINQVFSPKLSSQRLADGRMVSKALEEMAPFLSQEELLDNMLIPLWVA